MSDELWATVVATAVGIALTVIGRLVDRWLPDPEGKHPLPEPPATAHDDEAGGDGLSRA